jgi:hypothetical protein
MVIDEMKKLMDEYKHIDFNYEDDLKAFLKREISVLTKSLEETIAFLDNADEETIRVSSTVWDDISSFFKSNELIKAMERCVHRFPKYEKILSINLEDAKKVFNI